MWTSHRNKDSNAGLTRREGLYKNPSPSGWGLGLGLTTRPCENTLSRNLGIGRPYKTNNAKEMDLVFGTWNTRSLLKPGLLIKLTKQLQKYNLKAGFQVKHWEDILVGNDRRWSRWLQDTIGCQELENDDNDDRMNGTRWLRRPCPDKGSETIWRRRKRRSFILSVSHKLSVDLIECSVTLFLYVIFFILS